MEPLHRNHQTTRQSSLQSSTAASLGESWANLQPGRRHSEQLKTLRTLGTKKVLQKVKTKTRRTDLATAGVGTAEQRHVLVQQGRQVAEWAPVKEKTGRRIERRGDAASGMVQRCSAWRGVSPAVISYSDAVCQHNGKFITAAQDKSNSPLTSVTTQAVQRSCQHSIRTRRLF